MPRKKKETELKRPIAVTITAIVVILLFFVRIYQALKPLVAQDFFTYKFTPPIFFNGSLTEYGRGLIEGGVYLILAIGLIVVLVGFLRMKHWTWVFIMSWIGVSMIVSLIDYFYFGVPNYLIMASDVIIAFALSQSDVQRIFGIRSDTGEHIF
jgi:hypothetical protein